MSPPPADLVAALTGLVTQLEDEADAESQSNWHYAEGLAHAADLAKALLAGVPEPHHKGCMCHRCMDFDAYYALTGSAGCAPPGWVAPQFRSVPEDHGTSYYAVCRCGHWEKPDHDKQGRCRVCSAPDHRYEHYEFLSALRSTPASKAYREARLAGVPEPPGVKGDSVAERGGAVDLHPERKMPAAPEVASPGAQITGNDPERPDSLPHDHKFWKGAACPMCSALVPLPGAAANDERGLSIDMLDVDRLREWARLLLVHGADITHWGSVPFVAGKMQTMATEIEKAIRDIGKLRAEALPSPPYGWQARYYELLYAVSRKHPGENRHETALRYIRQAEQSDNTPKSGTAATPPPQPTRDEP